LFYVILAFILMELVYLSLFFLLLIDILFQKDIVQYWTTMFMRTYDKMG